MISIELWRGRIGAFNIKSCSRPSNAKDSGSLLSTSNSLNLIQTTMLGLVICMLLIMGGVESNPGPPTVAQDLASDSHCVGPTCKRKLGSSEIFKQHLLQPTNNSQSTLQVNPVANVYNVMGNLKNKFTVIDPSTGDNMFESEYNLVVDMEKRIKSEYDDVFTGKLNDFIPIPETFQYEKDMSISIHGLEERIKTEKEKGENAYGYTESEITRMENELKNMKGEVAENEVQSNLKIFFSKNRGVLFHSFHPENVLSPLTCRAKSQRQNAISLKWTPLEEKLAEILNINLGNVEQEAVIILNKTNLPRNQEFDLENLEKELDKQNRFDKKKFHLIKSMVQQIVKTMSKTHFNFNEAMRAISIGILYHRFRPDGEMDFVGVLPDAKLIFTFEAKYQIGKSSQTSTTLLDSATKQTKRNEEVISRLFGPMFSSEWRLVKVPIIMQEDSLENLDPNTYCRHCEKFIINSGFLNDLQSWFDQTKLGSINSGKTGLTQSYVECLGMLELIITSVSIIENLSAWERVLGLNFNEPISVGYTPSQGTFGAKVKAPSKKSGNSSLGNKIPDHISFDEAKHKAHDAQKLMFFSRLQLCLLNIYHCLSAILWGDYGTGKTLILKERAIRSKKKNRDVVFLSLGSSDPFGIPLKTPLVYDVVTKREMKKHKIDFHNAIELGQLFQHRTFSRVKGDNKQFVMDTVTKTFKEEITYPQMEKIFDQAGIDRVNAIAYFNQNKSKNAKPLTLDVYIALIEFVKKNRGKDIFVDELPILMNPKTFKYDHGSLKRLEEVLSECKSLMLPGTSFVVCLQSNNLQDMGAGYPTEWKKLVENCQKELNEKHQFICPTLDINFRNSASIYKSVNSIHKNEANTTTANIQNTLVIPKKGTTLDSSNVRRITFNWQNKNQKQNDLDKVIAYLFTNLEKDIDPLNEPLIILYDDSRFTIDQVQKSLKSLKNGIDVYTYPSFNTSDPEKEIDSFLSDPKGVLITSNSLFKGSEAENVVSIQYSSTTSSNVRGTLLRSVSRLYILMGLAENEEYKINNTINDASLLYCYKKSDLVLWECLDCSDQSKNKIMVCFPCTKRCHENHKFEVRGLKDYNLDGKCQCTSYHK